MMGDFATPAAANGSNICINNNAMNPGGNPNNVGIPKHSTVVERLRQRIEGCRRHHVNCENRYQQAHAEQLEIERRETVSLYQRSLEQRAKKSANSKHQSKQQDPESASSTEQRNNTLIALQETVKRKLDSARSPLNGDQNGICDGSYSPTTKRLRKDGSGGLDSLPGLPTTPVSPLHQLDIKPSLGGAGIANNPSVNNNNVNNCNSGPRQMVAMATTPGSGLGSGRPGDVKLNGDLPNIKVNGSSDLEDGFGLLKDLKQEPLDDGGIESSDTSLSNQNKLFSDINLNDQEWQELIDELANTVPEDDMQDLFNEDFEEKKEAEFTRPANQTPVPQDPPPMATVAHQQTNQAQGAPHVPMGSPQVRPSSSGPQFATAANGTPPQQPLQQSPQVAMASGSPLPNCVARSPQTPTQAQTQAGPRPGNGFMMNPGQGVGQAGKGSNGPGVPTGIQGPGPVTSELSPAEQLKAMAAQQRAKLMQQQKQQQQANWSPAGAPTSPYASGPFNQQDKPSSPMMYPAQAFNQQDKPNSPMMYPPQAFNQQDKPNSPMMYPAQAFNQQDKPNSPMMYPPQAFNPGPQGPLVAGMTSSNGPKAPMNNYLPQNPHNHMGMLSQQQQQQTNNMGAQQNTLSKQQQQQLQQQQTAAMLSYNNTKPLSHFSTMGVDHMGQRMTPPMGSQVKNPMMPPYMQQGGVQGAGPGQTQGPIPGQTAHLSEEQKRMLLMKQKVLNQSMPYSAMQPHGQVGRRPFWICCRLCHVDLVKLEQKTILALV
ncbi:LOW QUALITY PROTEIN: mastermind-like protein 3 [Salvelinus alpinus]